MVTDTLRGCTVSCTHCSRSEAKRWGSSARSQASCREQLWAEGAAVGHGGGSQRASPSPPATAQWAHRHPRLGEPSSFTLYPIFTGVKVGWPSLSQSRETAKRRAPHPGETQRRSKGSCECPTRTVRSRGAVPGQRLLGRGVCQAGVSGPSGPPLHPIQTHMLCRTHQPQWGSREPRHSSQDAYCTQLSTGTRVTWQDGDLSIRSRDPCQPHLLTTTVCSLKPARFPCMRGAPISGLSPAWSIQGWSHDPDLAKLGQTGRVSPLGGSGQEAISQCR